MAASTQPEAWLRISTGASVSCFCLQTGALLSYRIGSRKNHQLDEGLVDQMRTAMSSGHPFGNNRFRAEVEQAAGVRFGSVQRGRPRKEEKGWAVISQ